MAMKKMRYVALVVVLLLAAAMLVMPVVADPGTSVTIGSASNVPVGGTADVDITIDTISEELTS